VRAGNSREQPGGKTNPDVGPATMYRLLGQDESYPLSLKSSGGFAGQPTVIWVTSRSESTRIAIAVIHDPMTRATMR
jgi:hypothetical protein